MKIDLTQLPIEVKKYRGKVQEDPSDDSSWYHLARVYQKQQQFDLAEEAYSRALSIQTKGEYYLHLGEMLYDRKQYGKALAHLLEALKVEDEDWVNYSKTEALVDEIYSLDSCSL